MSITLIQNASLNTVKQEIGRILDEGIRSSNVRRLAEQAVAGNPDQIGAVFDFVHGTFPYQSDPVNAELFIHPNRVAEDYYTGRIRSMDCDDYALLTGAMLGSIGYQTRIVLLATGGLEINHAVAEVYSEKLEDWITVDASSPLPLGWVIRSNRRDIV